MNTSGIQPAGHVILVKPKVVEETTKSGIVLATATQRSREHMGQTEATVIALGPTAYSDQAQPWCAVGDQIIFARYAGTERVGADGEVYRLINDLDVKAIYTGGDNV